MPQWGYGLAYLSVAVVGAIFALKRGKSPVNSLIAAIWAVAFLSFSADHFILEYTSPGSQVSTSLLIFGFQLVAIPAQQKNNNPDD